jgi:hypothetical protein
VFRRLRPTSIGKCFPCAVDGEYLAAMPKLSVTHVLIFLGSAHCYGHSVQHSVSIPYSTKSSKIHFYAHKKYNSLSHCN